MSPFATLERGDFTCTDGGGTCKIRLSDLTSQVAYGSPAHGLTAVYEPSQRGHLIGLKFPRLANPGGDQTSAERVTKGQNGQELVSPTTWEALAHLDQPLRDAQYPCGLGGVPALGLAHTEDLIGTIPFDVPVGTARANTDCNGNFDPDVRVTIDGNLHFEPIFLARPEDVDRGTHRTRDDGLSQTGSQLTFDVQDPGVLRVAYEAKATGSAGQDGAVAGFLDTNLCWETPVIGGSDGAGPTTVTWNPARQPPPACATVDGVGMEPDALYTSLPLRNDDFGRKTATLWLVDPEFPDFGARHLLGSTEYEIFYDRLAMNHPITPAPSPNWFYYRIQQRIEPPAPVHCSPTPITYNAAAACPAGSLTRRAGILIDGPPVLPFRTEISICPAAAELSNHGLQATLEHEWAHREHFCDQVWGGDQYSVLADIRDQDLVQDAWELLNVCDPGSNDFRTCYCPKSHSQWVLPAETIYCGNGALAARNRALDWANPGGQFGAGEAQTCTPSAADCPP